MSEIQFACAYSNPKIRSVIGPFLHDFKWRSPLAKSLIDLFQESVGEPSIGKIRSSLSGQYLDEEIEKIVVSVKDFLEVKEAEVDEVVKDFSSFYQQQRLAEILESGEGSAVKIISEIREMNMVQNGSIPVVRMGELDVDQVMEEELNGMSIIPTSLQTVRNATPWKGYLRGQLVMVVASPGSGKTLLLLNEVVEQLKEGFKVVYAALGDMMKIDFIIRISSIVTGTDYLTVSLNPKQYFTKEVRDLVMNLRIITVAAGSVDMGTLHSYLESVVATDDDFDAFYLDYDANLARSVDNMYADGEDIYNKLSAIARPKRGKYRVVFVASQPKIQYWEEEELPKESANESSRKQAVVDIMITIGRSQQVKDKHAGVIRIAKARRGNEGVKSPYIVVQGGKFNEIEQHEYRTLKTYEG